MNYMDNWEKYYHSEERDPLVQLAIIHAQIEAIHPFVEGNGRPGRMLVPLLLNEKRFSPGRRSTSRPCWKYVAQSTTRR
jgi:Fic family protein